MEYLPMLQDMFPNVLHIRTIIDQNVTATFDELVDLMLAAGTTEIIDVDVDDPFELITLEPAVWSSSGDTAVEKPQFALEQVRQEQAGKWKRERSGDVESARRAEKASRESGNRAIASRQLHSQLKDVRSGAKNRWIESVGGRKRIWTMNDLEMKQQEEQDAVAAGFGSSGGLMTKGSSFWDMGLRALELTNEYRAKNGKPKLEWHAKMAEIGAAHSKNMGEGKVPFSHQGFNKRAANFPFRARSSGENVAMSHGLPDPAKVAVDGWISSPGHRANLVGNWMYCGIGVHETSDGKYHFTQLFAQT